MRLNLFPFSSQPWIASSGYLFASTLLGSAFGFVFWTVAARLYPPAEIGRSASLIAAISLVALLGDMGLSVVLVRYIADQPDDRSRFFNSLLTAVLLSTLVFTLVFILYFGFVPRGLNTVADPALLIVFAGGALAFAAAQFYDRLFVALQSSRWVLYRSILMHFARLAVLVALLGRFGEVGLLLAVGTGALVSLAASIWSFAPRLLPRYRLHLAFNGRYLTGRVRYALGSYVSQMAWGLPGLLFPLLVAALLGSEANARFYTSWMVANLLMILPLAVSTAALASAAASSAVESAIQMGVLWRAMRMTLLGLAVLVLGVLLFSHPILGIFGEGYIQAAGLLALLAISAFPYALNTFTISALRLAARPWGLVWLPGSITVLSLVLVALFGMRFGLTGLGLGWLLAQIMGSGLSWVAYQRSLREN